MDKRYQVFISSTYSDLITERQQVLQTLLQMDCIPTGMELFPAVDEEQFDFIKKVIDDCDYYILIIGGRYGSTTADGISFTEMEFDYAVEEGIHVIALVHGEPDTIPAGKTEMESKARAKLEGFREKVCKDRLIKKWTEAGELPGLVALSLPKAIKAYPATGWVRADAVSNTMLLEEINELRKRNEEMSTQLQNLHRTAAFDIEGLAQGDDQIQLGGSYKIKGLSNIKQWDAKVSWNQVIGFIGPHLLMNVHESSVNLMLAKSILKSQGKDSDDMFSHNIEEELFQTVKVQLMALGWIDLQALTTVSKTIALFWRLTDAGKAQMLHVRSVKNK